MTPSTDLSDAGRPDVNQPGATNTGLYVADAYAGYGASLCSDEELGQTSEETGLVLNEMLDYSIEN